MSHTKRDEEVEQYRSVIDQVDILEEELQTIRNATEWDKVHKTLKRIHERVKYMEELYDN